VTESIISLSDTLLTYQLVGTFGNGKRAEYFYASGSFFHSVIHSFPWTNTGMR